MLSFLFKSGDIKIFTDSNHPVYNVCIIQRRTFSTLEGIMSTSGGYLEYIGGCSVHQRDIMIHGGGYHEYIGSVQYIRRIP